MPIKYQPHIDILRAIAVFFVILNHLEFSWFSGGFIGVDIFFVISGYLITHNFIKEKENNQSFSFKNFYKRRVIRLAPAFFIVLIVTTISFLLIMTQNEIENYLKTVISSLILSSNIYFSTLLNDYFSISARSTPLLHFWSLSLEEQFYLLWPIILVLIYPLKNNLKIILIIFLIIISSTFANELTQYHPITAYYLLPARFFEFAIGSLIALIPYIQIQKRTSIILGSLSILGLMLSSYYINQNTLFPSYITLIPCLLTAIYIYTAHSFQHKKLYPIQYIGRISYPMYLWHWPLIVYLSLLSINITLIVKFILIILTIALSILTYELIEKKIKKHAHRLSKPILTIFALPSSLIILSILIYLPLDNKKTSHNNSEPASTTANTIKCIDQQQHPRDECFFGNTKQETIEIFLVGDSHANAQSGFIDYLAKNANKQGYEITFSSTAFLPNIHRSVFNTQTKSLVPIENFTLLNQSVLKIIQSQQPQFVVMGGYFPHNWIRNKYSSEILSRASSKDIFIKGLQNAINEIEKIGAKAILINDNPILIDVDINCSLRASANKCYFAQEKYLSDFSEWNTLLKKLKKQYPSLIIIDFNDIICKNEKCYSSLNNIPLYRDNQHLTYNGSKEIAIEYLKNHENPFKQESK